MMPPADDSRPARTANARAGNLVPEAEVAEMFGRIAPAYDRLNTIMTAGLDGGWRRAAVRAAGLRPGDAVVDVACGTGKLAAALARDVGPFGRVVGVDLATPMIRIARRRHRDLVQVEFVEGNALALPFDDHAFDAATIGFGLRNLSDFRAGLAEMRRVVRPGGRVVCLELTTPRPAWWGRIFLATFRRLAPAAATLFGFGPAYRYLPASLEGFPDVRALTLAMRDAGLEPIVQRRLGLGAVALHVGVVPGTSPGVERDRVGTPDPG
jgi:demethylmenaquinone methyltransferase / 2-methoxy-6-polyprenyl-1,4-benzoquinol methylase